jgi:hypothetical protein
MRLKRKLIILSAYAMASKHAIAASAGTAVTAAVVSNDWVTWAVAGAGAVAYRLKKPEVKKAISIGNGIISVGVGGLGAPYVVSLVMTNGYPQPPVYLCAFLTALLWPYLWDKFFEKKDAP